MTIILVARNSFHLQTWGETMKRWLPAVLLFFLSVGLAAPAVADECEGVKMPDSTTVDGTKLVLNGMGVREATMFKINVYVAGLYVEDKSRDGSKLAAADSKKKLILAFVRDVDRSDIVDAYQEGLEKSAGKQYGQLKPKLDRLNSWMASTKMGSTQTYTYVPGKGLQVQVNGETKGTIEGADFAEAFFLIWLGENPPNEGLKTGLLGGECG